MCNTLSAASDLCISVSDEECEVITHKPITTHRRNARATCISEAEKSGSSTQRLGDQTLQQDPACDEEATIGCSNQRRVATCAMRGNHEGQLVPLAAGWTMGARVGRRVFVRGTARFRSSELARWSWCFIVAALSPLKDGEAGRMGARMGVVCDAAAVVRGALLAGFTVIHLLDNWRQRIRRRWALWRNRCRPVSKLLCRQKANLTIQVYYLFP